MGNFYLTMREFWREGKAGAALFLISVFVAVYGFIAVSYEVTQGWKEHVSVQNVMKDISAFIPVGGILVGMLIGGIDLMMLFSDWYFERQQRRLAAAKAEGRVEGRAEGEAVGLVKGKAAGRAEGEAAGRAEGLVEGRAEVYQEIAAWDRRRREAEARGEAFTEPLPSASVQRSKK